MPISETTRRFARFVLPMLACAAIGACSVAPPGNRASASRAPDVYGDMLEDDEKPSPFATYFMLDDPTQRQEIVLRAFELLGVDYLWGGDDPEIGLDCSGMVSYLVERISGRKLPHHAATIAQITRPIKRHELAPGDLVFFNTLGRRHSHMGIYIGDNRFIHAPAPGQKVRVERLNTRYYTEHLDGLHTLIRTGN
ncbi:MAG: C40 family peptidase [Azoarcus sp.]|jgi:cell wall-associated NlpC family hydrolase|nr:C40 family peptidase [Azoarcus sp.]